jgi:hypothetical protein
MLVMSNILVEKPSLLWFTRPGIPTWATPVRSGNAETAVAGAITARIRKTGATLRKKMAGTVFGYSL